MKSPTAMIVTFAVCGFFVYMVLSVFTLWFGKCDAIRQNLVITKEAYPLRCL